MNCTGTYWFAKGTEAHPYESLYDLSLACSGVRIMMPEAKDDYRVRVAVSFTTGVVAGVERWEGMFAPTFITPPDSAYYRIWTAASLCGASSESVKAALAALIARIRVMTNRAESEQFLAEWNRRAGRLCLAVASAELALGDAAAAYEWLAAKFAEWVTQDPRAHNLFLEGQIEFELSLAGRHVALEEVSVSATQSATGFMMSKILDIPAALLAKIRAHVGGAPT